MRSANELFLIVHIPTGRRQWPSIQTETSRDKCAGYCRNMATILLIDDDASLLDMLAMAFEDAGYSVETAPDGADSN